MSYGLGEGKWCRVPFSSPFLLLFFSFLLGVGLRGINAVQAVGGAANAAENLQNGNYLGAAMDAVGVLGNVSQALKSCFAAGTPLLTPTGDKPIEQFRVGELLLSAPEGDPEGPLESQRVEEVYVRVAPVRYLHVGGRVIPTTAEHPFYVVGKGWRTVAELREGDRLRSHDGNWVAVEAVTDTGEVTTVYNLRVAEYHTYFVGSRGWGFSVWAHNANPICGGAGNASSKSAPAAAKAEADAIRAEGQSGAAAGLETANGTYTGRSTGAGGGPLHPEVERVYGTVPEELRPDYHGDCAEGRAVSNAIKDGADVSGGKMAVRRAGGPDHGEPMTPCPSCQWMMDFFGIRRAK